MAELPNVISVEDDAELFRLIQLTLRSLPIRLYHATTGTEALRLISEIKTELLILDITLPDMRGWDVLDEITKLNLEVKAIVVTGRTETAHRLIARLQNVTGYLNKPFKPAELRQKVVQVLNLDMTS